MEIVKRNGDIVPYDSDKVYSAVSKCMSQVRGAVFNVTQEQKTAQAVSVAVLHIVTAKIKLPTVEQIQDLVEMQLMALSEYKAAKHYIVYRLEHEDKREKYALSDEEAAKIGDDSQYFGTELQRFQFMDKYARWHQAAGRRETWNEAVSRVMRFFISQVGYDKIPAEMWRILQQAMLNMDAMPSMRILQMAGPALERCHVGVYNCSYAELDGIKSLSEFLYVLMQGTGAGFSVEVDIVESWPRIRRQTHGRGVKHTIVVPDSTEGWCDALQDGLKAWHAGLDVQFDYSLIRPQGAILKTKGGRASGPEPLKRLLSFTRDKVLSRQGGCLTTLDVHDIACMCGDIVQVGGVRRAATISLSTLDDRDMRGAKDGQFWIAHDYRRMANNSAVYDGKPSSVEFMEEWLSLAKSGTGERGIFNREGVIKQIPKRRKKAKFGVNPCGEIILRSKEFCNLSIAVARADDSEESLAMKVRLATIFGTLQSTLTNFKYLSPEWKANCDEERLLGVDINGQMDCPLLQPAAEAGPRQMLLMRLKQIALDTNKEFAELLGIPVSAAVTCVKPSGNSSTLFNCSSGLHGRFAPYYIRRVRVSAYGPIAKVLKDAMVPWKPEIGSMSPETASILVFEFPTKSPEGAVTIKGMTAIAQLNNWLDLKQCYTEHNPSCTIHIGPDEWIDAGHWVYSHWELIGGLSFLPRDGGIYPLAPYEEITEEEYQARAAAMPVVDYSKLARYEREDMTTGAQDFACVAGACEI